MGKNPDVKDPRAPRQRVPRQAERLVTGAGVVLILLALLLWTGVALGAAQEVRIAGLMCHEWDDAIDQERYVEVGVEIEAAPEARYRMLVVLSADRSALGVPPVFDDTLSGSGHATPAFPAPDADSLFAGVRLIPLSGAPPTGEAWIRCTLLPHPRRTP